MAASAPEEHELPRSTVLALALLTLTGITAVLCYLIVRPFVPSVAWALAVAVVTIPVLHRLERWMRRSRAAAVTTVAAGVAIVLPAFLAGHQLAREAVHAY